MNIEELIYHNVYVCTATVVSHESDLFGGDSDQYNVMIQIEVEDKTAKVFYSGYANGRPAQLEEIRVRHGKVAAVDYYLSRKRVERQINRIVRQAIDEYRKTETIG